VAYCIERISALEAWSRIRSAPTTIATLFETFQPFLSAMTIELLIQRLFRLLLAIAWTGLCACSSAKDVIVISGRDNSNLFTVGWIDHSNGLR